MEPKENQEMIDSTDSLEAVIVMKGIKNFLFWLLLIAMLVAQTVFWMNRYNLIDQSDCAACTTNSSTSACPMTCHPVAARSAFIPLSAVNPIAEQAEGVIKTAEQQISPDSTEPAEPIVLKENASRPDESLKDEGDQASRSAEFELDRLRMSCQTAHCVIRVSNFVMFMAAVLYCLTLLMNLKISLTGKLGGINHITRAFFCSLFMLVFLTPWQTLLPGVAIGAIYLPGELLCDAWAKADSSMFWKVLLYLRFTGLWLIVLWLLFCAQSRSIKWARATLRRLGMVR